MPLVMLPGMMCDARLFAPQIDYFSPSRQVIVPDIAHISSKENSINGMAQSILAQAPNKIALLGLSMGGIVAMEMLRQAPERIAGVALLDTNPLAEATDMQNKRELQIKRALQGELALILQEEMKPRYLADDHGYESHSPQQQIILDLCMDMAMALGLNVFINQSMALKHRQDQQACLRQSTIPALVLMGAADRICPLERHQLMAKLLKNSEMAIIDHAGHLPTLEQPDTTNRAITKWLQRL